MLTMDGEPAIRASMTKGILSMVDQLPGLLPTRIREAVGDDSVEAIEEALPVAWVPLGTQMRLVEEVRRQLTTDARYHRFWREHMVHSLKQPVLRAAFEGAKRVFGVGPRGLLRVSARTWAGISRGCGTLHLEPSVEGVHQVSVVLDDFPREQFRSGTFAEGYVGSFRGVLDATDQRGHVHMTAFEPAKGRAVYEVSWKEPS